MRKVLVLAMAAALVGVGGLARDASAGATIDLLFTAVNGAPIAPTDTVTVSPTDVLSMSVRVSTDSGLSAAAFSLQYDVDDATDELDVVGANLWTGLSYNAGTMANPDIITYAPLGTLSDNGSNLLASYNGFTNDFAAPVMGHNAGSVYEYGTVKWQVNPGDAVTILSGLFNTGIDAIGDLGFNDIGADVLFNSATVIIPEPATASLLALGLLGLVVAGRRAS